MATFTLNRLGLQDLTALTTLDLTTGPHDFTYSSGGMELVVNNAEAGNITLVILGDGVTTVDIPKLGDTDLSAGKSITVTPGQSVINLDEICGYLGSFGNNVNVTITGAASSDTVAALTVRS